MDQGGVSWTGGGASGAGGGVRWAGGGIRWAEGGASEAGSRVNEVRPADPHKYQASSENKKQKKT